MWKIQLETSNHRFDLQQKKIHSYLHFFFSSVSFSSVFVHQLPAISPKMKLICIMKGDQIYCMGGGKCHNKGCSQREADGEERDELRVENRGEHGKQ